MRSSVYFPGLCCAVQGMRDLGLEQLGAQLSLLGKQVTQGLNAILPADINPFGLDDEEWDEEAAAR